MGAKLAPSRERGVLVMASGNVVHNLRAMDWNLADKGYDWAKRFDEDAKELILSDPADAAPLEGHTDFAPRCRHQTISYRGCTSLEWQASQRTSPTSS